MTPLFSSQKPPKKQSILFFGTPEFSAVVLDALLKEHYSVRAAITKPDMTVGREKKLIPSPVKESAIRGTIPVLQPRRLDADFIKEIQEYHPDIILTVAYGKILPKNVLNLPRCGCVNVHASLLPLYRGASPIQNAILNGDEKTGVTLLKMEEGLDSGPIYAQNTLALEEDELFPKVSSRLAKLSASLVLETLPNIFSGTINPMPQKEKDATYCQLIEKEDGRIYWNTPAREIFNMYRAFYSWPGIYTHWKTKNTITRLKLLRIRLWRNTLEKNYGIGEVYQKETGIFVNTPLGTIEILEIQAEGRNPLEIREFTRGASDFIGSVLQ